MPATEVSDDNSLCPSAVAYVHGRVQLNRDRRTGKIVLSDCGVEVPVKVFKAQRVLPRLKEEAQQFRCYPALDKNGGLKFKLVSVMPEKVDVQSGLVRGIVKKIEGRQIFVSVWSASKEEEYLVGLVGSTAAGLSQYWEFNCELKFGMLMVVSERQLPDPEFEPAPAPALSSQKVASRRVSDFGAGRVQPSFVR